MLKMSHLSKVYRTHMVETHALRDFSIHVRDGEFVAVTGPSGSGKTTFLNIAGLLEDFSGGEYWLDGVDVPLRYRRFPAAERKRRIDEALTRVGLASRMKHYPAELSGGQQQRVAIARALAGSPKLLMADEPTGNLDSLMARGVMELLEEINRQGTTIIMVTHDPELAARAQRNVHIIDGQVTDFDEEPKLRSESRAASGEGRNVGVVA
jgi:putative ABC transport system ATP-binding protein